MGQRFGYRTSSEILNHKNHSTGFIIVLQNRALPGLYNTKHDLFDCCLLQRISRLFDQKSQLRSNQRHQPFPRQAALIVRSLSQALISLSDSPQQSHSHTTTAPTPVNSSPPQPTLHKTPSSLRSVLPPKQPHPHLFPPPYDLNLTAKHNTNPSSRNSKTMPAASEKPTGWTAAMTAFLKHVLSNGEDNQSAIILLETEFPAMVKQVKVGWVERVRKGEVA